MKQKSGYVIYSGIHLYLQSGDFCYSYLIYICGSVLHVIRQRRHAMVTERELCYFHYVFLSKAHYRFRTIQNTFTHNQVTVQSQFITKMLTVQERERRKKTYNLSRLFVAYLSKGPPLCYKQRSTSLVNRQINVVTGKENHI